MLFFFQISEALFDFRVNKAFLILFLFEKFDLRLIKYSRQLNFIYKI